MGSVKVLAADTEYFSRYANTLIYAKGRLSAGTRIRLASDPVKLVHGHSEVYAAPFKSDGEEYYIILTDQTFQESSDGPS